MRRVTSDLCLNQVIPLCANVFKEARDVDRAFMSDLRHHAVQDDVGARPANASAAEQQGNESENIIHEHWINQCPFLLILTCSAPPVAPCRLSWLWMTCG